MNTVSKRTFNLVLGGLMIAMGTVLGFIKPFGELPYGGSITVCSMLPVMFYSYRCGLKWGLGAGLVFSVLQLLFGLDALKGISAVMVVGSILLDYILAFTVLGLAGMFRGKIKNDAAAFTLGSFVAMMLRYFCSFLSGWVLWASFNETADMQEFIGTFIPPLANASGTALAVIYSLVYNGVYMIPEIILTCVVGFLLVQFAGNQILDKPAK
ncbi:MAG: energy-coupled thiamine transporter ThiT [Acutalibacter sp.]|jgi:thiamine transporter